MDRARLHVLLVEDDPKLARLTRDYFEQQGLEVTRVADGPAAIREGVRPDIDVVVLDLMLPGCDGFEVCREIRKSSHVPIIAVTARVEVADRVLGLELGADDYVTKPFSARELLARIHAVTRRAQGKAGPAARELCVGRLRLDVASFSALLDGRPLLLTSYEFSLLRVLAENAGRVLSRERLLELAKGNADEAFDRSIDVRISRLRQKLGDDSRHPTLLKTVRGSGYVLAASEGAVKRLGRQRLLLRVYLHGILMLSLAAGASFVVGSYVLRPAVELPTRPSTAWIAWHMMAIADQPERLEQELSSLKRRAHLEITLFDASGRAIAGNATTPAAPLSAGELARLPSEPTHFADGFGVVADLGADGQVLRYARVKYPATELPLGTAVAQLAVALLVLALLSIPLARSVTAPVDALAALTRAFGRGDLAVRSKSARRDEIGDLARAFDEMAERIVGLRRSEKELLANVSHELRTPLARIRLALELVSDGDTSRAKSYLQDIEEDLGELERLLDDIMTMAELDLARGSGRDALPPLRREVIPGERLLALARERFERRYEDRKLEVRADAELPCVDADPGLLRRVLDNLLDNAVKFSDPGEAVELAATRGEAGELVVSVSDRGMGIAPADLERVFEPFFRSDRSRNRSTGGVGLGLAVVRRILDAHGGSVRASSDGERGTRFRVVVPATDSADGPAAAS